MNEALKLYQKIVQDFPDHRRVAAKAQLQIGICYEKLGQQKAVAAYQKVLENYPDQREIVALVLERLAQAQLYKDESYKIYVLRLEDSQKTEVQFDLPANSPTNFAGYDGPVWSPDGKLMLCRSLNQFDLWANSIRDGKPAGKAHLAQPDLPHALLSMKGINDPIHDEMNQSLNKSAIFRNIKNSGNSFAEEFSSPILDPAWSVFEWKRPNVYDYASFGHYSLIDRPGHLRYYLDQIMDPGHLVGYLPQFTGWYWKYPSLEISRPLDGGHWVLETKVTYSMVDGANGRGFTLVVYFEPDRDRQTALVVHRGKEIALGSTGLGISLYDRGVIIAANDKCLSPNDTLGVTQFTYFYRITRADTLIQVELSDDDGGNFRQVFSASLRADLRGQPQLLALTGDSWFVPAGAYADWDYVRFRIVDF